MKTIFALATAAIMAAGIAYAAPTTRAGGTYGTRGSTKARAAAAAAAEEEAPSGKDAKITIDQFPKTGRQSTMSAPSLSGGSIIGRCYTKPRSWIVMETKYTTYAKWQEQLTFTWHVLLETKSATENKGNKEGLAPYSYFTTSVTYQNIPQGSHAASVCLHPSYLERYGEPKAIGIVITNRNGDILNGDTESEIKGIEPHSKFWEDPKIMDAKQNGEPMIERRQGLQDRSKTIWALVNPNDYEQVVQ